MKKLMHVLDAGRNLCHEMDREEIREYLSPVYDMERLISRVSYQSANPRDLISFKSSISMIPYIRQLLSQFQCEELKKVYEEMDDLQDLYQLLRPHCR